MRLDGVRAVLLAVGVERYVEGLDAAVHVQMVVVKVSCTLVAHVVVMGGRRVGLFMMARYHGMMVGRRGTARVATKEGVEAVEATVGEHGGACVDARHAWWRFHHMVLLLLLMSGRERRVHGEAVDATWRLHHVAGCAGAA